MHERGRQVTAMKDRLPVVRKDTVNAIKSRILALVAGEMKVGNSFSQPVPYQRLVAGGRRYDDVRALSGGVGRWSLNELAVSLPAEIRQAPRALRRTIEDLDASYSRKPRQKSTYMEPRLNTGANYPQDAAIPAAQILGGEQIHCHRARRADVGPSMMQIGKPVAVLLSTISAVPRGSPSLRFEGKLPIHLIPIA